MTIWSALKALRHARRSVRGKLVGMALLITVIVLLVSATAILGHDLKVYRASWAADVASEASILALSTAPALAFDDRELAAHNLAALESRPAVLAAALYTPDGRLYASYLRSGQPPLARREQPPAEGIVVNGESVEIAQRITYHDEFLGTIYLRARYDVAGRVRAYLGIFAFIASLSLLLALVLSASLQRTITAPLEAMAEVARQVVHRGDHRLRVAHSGDDEIGIVVRAFNNMLDEVEQRTRALERTNDSLLQQIAERQVAESALARANARLESTMAAAEIGGWVLDLKSGNLAADRNFAALYGLPDESVFTTDPDLRRRLIHAQDRAAVDAAERAALHSGTLASTEHRIVQPDGGERWVIGRGKVQFDADGSARYLAGLLIDVTAQKRAEERRRESEKIYRAIGESINYGIWLADAEGRNTYASESFLRLIGVSQEEFSGFGWTEQVHPDDAAPLQTAWRECIRGGHNWYFEFRVRGRDGCFHEILAQGVPIRREDGSIYAWAGLNLDISRLKQTEQALREADRRKDEFLATLAHELRNPLAPIRHAIRVLAFPQATEQQRHWGQAVIDRQVQHMALLLDDLLDVSRITRGRLELKKEPVDLADLVGSAIETARPLIEARRHRLELRLPERRTSLHVDSLRMSQVLSNLLTNAAKYTDRGGLIELIAGVDAEGVAIAVRDNGIGLSPGAIPQLFEMFSQVESAMERSQGGLGIGLALARGLVRLHGGVLDVVSAGPGRGSTFTVRLPPAVLVQPAASAGRPPREAGAGGHAGGEVLVADDNRDAADSLAILLGMHGYRVHTAYSGREAQELAGQVRPQAAILDIGMPYFNGHDLARYVREQAWGRSVLLIALSGWAQQEDIERAKGAGFDHYFRKPVNVEELVALLAAGGLQHGPAGAGAAAVQRST